MSLISPRFTSIAKSLAPVHSYLRLIVLGVFAGAVVAGMYVALGGAELGAGHSGVFDKAVV